jgi:hypothetical protein
MFGTVIGVVIGLAFVYLLLSFAATWIQELIATAFQLRSRELMNMVQNLLDPTSSRLDGAGKLREKWDAGAGVIKKINGNFTKALYEHPLIKGLAKGARMPSYIPTGQFSAALFDILTRAGTEAAGALRGFDAFSRGVGEIENAGVRNALQCVLSPLEEGALETGKRAGEARDRITQWLDAAMERVSGWYKRKAQIIAVAIGISLAAALNVDSLRLAGSLWHEGNARRAAGAAASLYLASGRNDGGETESALETLESLPLPLGWAGYAPETPGGFLLTLLGWILTGIAVSQGAPIWFDLLNAFVNLRGSGKAPAPGATTPSGRGGNEK